MHELGDALLKLNSKRVILLGNIPTFVILESIYIFSILSRPLYVSQAMTVATAKKFKNRTTS